MSDDRTTRLYTENPEPNAAQQNWTPCLVALQGTQIGNKFLLDKDEIAIGRSKKMDICLEQHEVSRKHAIIVRRNDRYTIIDQSSKNGTWLNAVSIASAILHDKDLIGIGDNVLKFLAANSNEQAYYDEIYRQTCMDQVLQVFNKHYFTDKLEHEMERCRRYGGELSLLLLDADRFKQLNDTYGHLAGDAALLHLTGLIKTHVRKIDSLCRYGGEEFAVILPHTGPIQAYIVAEHIRKLIAETPFEYAGTQIPMSVCIGVAGCEAAQSLAQSAQQFVERADRALYSAKSSGRNKVVMSSDFVEE
ncbi:MAG: diguanylate cyclase [Gammaproteobacteria bacterium]